MTRLDWLLFALIVSHLALATVVLWMWREDRADLAEVDRATLAGDLASEHITGRHEDLRYDDVTTLLCPACERARWTGIDVGPMVETETDKWLRKIDPRRDRS